MKLSVMAMMRHSPYDVARNFHLNELRRVRAMVRVGTATTQTASKERRSIQRELAALRKRKR